MEQLLLLFLTALVNIALNYKLRMIYNFLRQSHDSLKE